MNIAFDTHCMVSSFSRNRGIGIYAEKLIDNIIKNKRIEDNIILTTYNGMESIRDFQSADNRKIYLGPNVEEYKWLFNCDGMQEYGAKIMEYYFRQNKIELFHLPNYSEAPFNFSRYKCCQQTNTVFTATVHDLIPLVFENVYLSNNATRTKFINDLQILHNMDAIIVDSYSTKNDIIKYLNINENKIHVVYLASDYDRYIKESSNKTEVFKKFNITKPFLLYTGGDDYRKNITGLIEAFSESGQQVLQNYQLVIVCKLYQKEFYNSLIKKLQLEQSVILTDYVLDSELVTFYKNARAFIFPSKYEGFGLPILEAMQFDLPIAVSNKSSMPEIVGNEGLIFDPYNRNDISKSIYQILCDELIRDKLIENSKIRRKLFSWEKCAKENLRIFEHTIKDKHNKKINYLINTDTNINKRLKAAFLSPLNPDKSGISDYSEDLIPYINNYLDIDIYTSIIDITNKIIKETNKVYTYSEFENNHYKYDTIIYQMGNSMYHWEIFKYIKKYPGIVVLHDYNERVFFDHIGNWMKNSPVDSSFILDNFLIQYEKDGPRFYNRYKDTLCHERNVEFNRIVTSNSQAVIVHSDFALKRLQEFSPMLPVTKIYQATPSYPEQINSERYNALREKYSIKSNDIVIASFGFAIPEKRDHILIEAFGELMDKICVKNNIKLLFVGKLWEGFNDTFNQIIKKYNIKDNVIVTGWTEMDEFVDLMYVCDIAFNLRYPTNGETSACLSRLLAIGKPVVVTNIDAFAEYPDDVCIKIRYDSNEKSDIIQVLDLLINDENKRKQLSSAARNFMQTMCTLEKSALAYYEYIKIIYDLYNRPRLNVNRELIMKIRNTYEKETGDLTGLNDELASVSEILSRI